MKTIFRICVFGGFAVGSLFAQDTGAATEESEVEEKIVKDNEGDYDPFCSDEDYQPMMIRVQTEFIEMAHKDLTRVMMEDKSKTSDATGLRMKVQDMVDEDKAKVIDTQLVISRSGEKSTAESRSEFIYPTEYEPPSFDDEFSEEMKENIFPVNPSNPTAFETRNLGSLLECEAVLGEDNQIVDLRVFPSIVWHTGNTVWNESKDELGNVSKVSMPEIYALEVKTGISIIAGQYCLLGIVSPKGAEGQMDADRKVMVFVKCQVLPVIQ
ncbi:MAG: hypothetical protein ACSHX9_12300 [Luteolibacter sp.]